jgi:hypothetical protein
VLLRLNLSNGSRPGSLPPARVTLRLNGRKLHGTIEPGSRFRTVDIPVPPSEYGLANQVLTIETNTWNPYYAGRGGSQDRALGVVVEGLEIIRPNSSLERGLAKVAGARHHEGLLMVQAFADQFGRQSDWRIPLGLALAHQKAGRVSLARDEFKESLHLSAEDNEAYRLLRQLAVRHDNLLRDREHPEWRDDREREGPPPVSEHWVQSLVTPGESPRELQPGGSLRLAYNRLDHNGLAVVQVVTRQGGDAEHEGPAPRLELLLDGASLGTFELSDAGWQSLIFSGLPAPGTAHTLKIALHGETPVEIKRILAY